MKSKMAATLVTVLNDVTDLQQRYYLLHSPHLVDHMTGYLLKVKYFPNIVTPQKNPGKELQQPLPPRLVVSRDMSLRERLTFKLLYFYWFVTYADPSFRRGLYFGKVTVFNELFKADRS